MERLAEEWRAVVGWEGFYEVSNLGRVRSLPRMTVRNGHALTVKGGILSANIACGYPNLSLRVNGRYQTATIHRLVGFAFVPNPHGYLEINHIDGNKANARADNLEWCTRQHNNKHAWRTGLHQVSQNQVKGADLWSNKLTEDQVRSIRKERSEGVRASLLGRKYDVSAMQIARICKRESWKHVI